MRTQIDVGIFSYAGITDVKNYPIYDAEYDHNAPIASRAYNKPTILHARFFSDHRVIHNAKLDHP